MIYLVTEIGLFIAAAFVAGWWLGRSSAATQEPCDTSGD